MLFYLPSVIGALTTFFGAGSCSMDVISLGLKRKNSYKIQKNICMKNFFLTWSHYYSYLLTELSFEELVLPYLEPVFEGPNS